MDVRFENRPLCFSLDTGAWRSALLPAFRAEYPDVFQASVNRREKRTGGGASGQGEYEVTVLPDMSLSVGGFSALLSPAEVLLIENSNPSLHGLFGMDLLNQSRSVTIDFNAMRITLQRR